MKFVSRFLCKLTGEMVCNTITIVASAVMKDERVTPAEGVLPVRKKSLRRLASTRGLKSIPYDEDIKEKLSEPEIQQSGWVRIYAGPDPFADMKSQLLYLNRDSDIKSVAKSLPLPSNLTIWIQYGSGISRRLPDHECPLKLQDEFLIKLGFHDMSRRSRMGIDPDLRFLIRIHGGPAPPPPGLPVAPRSAPLQVLKGLVFPNWKRRPVALVGSKLLLYPGNCLYFMCR